MYKMFHKTLSASTIILFIIYVLLVHKCNHYTLYNYIFKVVILLTTIIFLQLAIIVHKYSEYTRENYYNIPRYLAILLSAVGIYVYLINYPFVKENKFHLDVINGIRNCAGLTIFGVLFSLI